MRGPSDTTTRRRRRLLSSFTPLGVVALAEPSAAAATGRRAARPSRRSRPADGYGIYVERDARGNLLTNADLDAGHDRTSTVAWNGKKQKVFHYAATLEYPYTIGCFHGTAIKNPGRGSERRGCDRRRTRRPATQLAHPPVATFQR